MSDSVPLLVFTGQVNRAGIGKDAFQEADIVGITMPITKYNYQVRETADIPRIITEAVHIAVSYTHLDVYKRQSLVKVKVDNMRNQHEAQVEKEERQAKPVEEKEYAIIAVVAGDGLADIFKAQGVDYIISGGQTMNPSTEDFVKAVEELNARNIIILPNNKNILMAAQSAAEVIDQPAAVVETKTIPQGLTSLLAFDESKSIEENYERMSASLGDVASGSVTTAVRDTTIDGLEIHENDNLGMVDGKIVVSNPDMMETLEETFAHMLDEDSEIVTIYVGEDGSEELANELAQVLAEKYEDVEVEIHQGGQPVYPYLFSVE